MRVLFIVHRFPPNFLGGADIYTYNIAAELQNRGHTIWVMCADNLHDPTTEHNEVRTTNEPYRGLPVRRLHFNFRKMSDPYGWLYVANPVIERLTQEYIDEIKPDVVHVTACDYVTVSVITAAKKARRPVVLTLTGKWHICPVATLLRWDGELCAGRQPGLTCLRCLFGETKVFKSLRMLPMGIRRRLIQWTGQRPQLFRRNGSLNFIHAIERRNVLFEKILSQVDYILSPSHCHRQIFAKTGIIREERIVYSPTGYQLSLEASGRVKTDAQGIRFGYTGRVFPHKGLDTLILAFNRLHYAMPVFLNVFGDVDAKSEYGRQVLFLAKGNPAIVLRGRFDPQEIGKVLSVIDVLVVPSRCVENSPLTIAEAFTAQIPVIGSDVCGIAEHIRHDVDGLLFLRGDPVALATQMQRLIDAPELLSSLRKGIKPVRTQSDEANELERVYSKLITQGLRE